MKSEYIQELEFFDKSEILDKLGNNEVVLNKLRLHDIIHKNKKGEYNFHYVGLIVIDDLVLNIYPKYFSNNKNYLEENFNQVIKVINKYDKVHSDFDNQNDDLEDISIFIISLMLFFIEDYYENGVYQNTKNIIVTNGNGEINWDKTINNTFPILKNNTPYYVELQTNYKKDDLFNYFRLLHEYVITECSNKLNEIGLLSILNLTPIELSDKIQKDFGDIHQIINMIDMELNVEFNTHKRKLLKSMHAFFTQMNSLSNDKILTVYGVTDYEYIWEEVCSEVFDNKIDKKISDLGLKSDKDCSLREFINKPIWNIFGRHFSKNRLRPDIITVRDDMFLIFDAKYYHFKIEDNKLKDQPELESITKQYLYELAYKDLINHNKLNVKNAFLFPIDGNNFIEIGFVELDIWNDLNLKNIDIIMVPDKLIYECYLENEIIDLINNLDIKTNCEFMEIIE